MNIKMSNASMLDTFRVMNKFTDCTGKLAYALSKTRRKMAAEVKDFEDTRDGLIRKYGSEDEEGNIRIEPNTEGYQKFIDEIIPISQDVVEIDVYQITKEEFDDADYYCEDATVRDYEILEALFVKNEEKDEPQEKVENNDGDE